MGKHLKKREPKDHRPYFWSYYEYSSECWNWKRGCNDHGYGMLFYHRKQIGAHRIAYMLAHNLEELPELDVLHKCDNTRCGRPSHLYLGTHYQNMQDKVARNRQKGERQALHKLTDAAVRDIRTSNLSNKELALKYSVQPGTIRSAKVGINWRHITIT